MYIGPILVFGEFLWRAMPGVLFPQEVTDVSYSIITKLSEEIHSSQDPLPMQGFLEFLPFSLPNKTIPQDTANNLTQVL